MAHIMNDAGLKLFGLILWGIYVISKCSRDSGREQMNFYSQEYMDVNKVARIYVTESNMEFVFENMFPYETFIR